MVRLDHSQLDFAKWTRKLLAQNGDVTSQTSPNEMRDLVKELLWVQIMPGEGAVIIRARDVSCTGVETFWYVW